MFAVFGLAEFTNTKQKNTYVTTSGFYLYIWPDLSAFCPPMQKPPACTSAQGCSSQVQDPAFAIGEFQSSSLPISQSRASPCATFFTGTTVTVQLGRLYKFSNILYSSNYGTSYRCQVTEASLWCFWLFLLIIINDIYIAWIYNSLIGIIQKIVASEKSSWNEEFLLDIHQICSRLVALGCKKLGGVDGPEDNKQLQDKYKIR